MKRSQRKHTAANPVPPELPETVASLAEGMADDFNNILTTVMAACTLIDKDDPENGELLKCVALIRTSAERAANLSDRLMRVGVPLQAKEKSKRVSRGTSTVGNPERDKMNIGDIVSSTK